MSFQDTGKQVLLFTGNSHQELARLVASRLSVKLGTAAVFQKTNKESQVEIQESVRGKDVFILQTGSKDVNDAIMELLIMAYACKTSSAKRIIGVIPYLPYSKQCKMRKRGAIASKLLASMMCKAGLQHVITMDLHQKEIQGFYEIPVDNLRASPFLISYIQDRIPADQSMVVVAKTPAAAKKAQSYAERLRVGIAVIHGEPQDYEGDQDQNDGRNSPPLLDIANDKQTGCWPQSFPEGQRNQHKRPRTYSKSQFDSNYDFPLLTAKEKPPINVVGDVQGKIAIIVDDIIDDVEPFIAAATAVKERGALKVFVVATHGILSIKDPEILQESSIDEVIVTNTVPHEGQKLQINKIKTVDISFIISEAIRRIHYGESMSYLFRNISLDD